MCTATWLWDDQGYWLFFNRDERRRRKRAEPPARYEVDGLSYLAPRDGDAGGTWLAVSELGLSLALLNYYDAPALEAPVEGAFTSRGMLVASLVAAPGLAEVERRLSTLDLLCYRPFTLLALTPSSAALFEWTGNGLSRHPEPVPRLLSSSGFDAPTAERLRRELLSTVDADSAAELRRFHASHRPQRGAFSPCMHRDDASTVSFSRVRVRCRRVSFEYADGPPCVTALAEPVELDRRWPVEMAQEVSR